MLTPSVSVTSDLNVQLSGPQLLHMEIIIIDHNANSIPNLMARMNLIKIVKFVKKRANVADLLRI